MSAKDVEDIIQKYHELSRVKKLTVSDIFAGQKQLTQTVSDRITTGYENIEEAMNKLNIGDKDVGQKKHDLQQLKIFVPRKFAITKENMLELNQALNEIVAGSYAMMND